MVSIKRLQGMDDTRLEQMIDRYGLPSLMNQISEIADGKRQHVEENWPDDKGLAKAWGKASRFFDACIETTASFGIPE